MDDKPDLEYDLKNSPLIIKKIKTRNDYAQNLYAALCNNRFVKNTVYDVLKNNTWTCSWRYAGGIVADIKGVGDYMDWYCSGIIDLENDGQSIDLSYKSKYVGESVVTDEIRDDLKHIGWKVTDYDNDDD